MVLYKTNMSRFTNSNHEVETIIEECLDFNLKSFSTSLKTISSVVLVSLAYAYFTFS